ncbi:PLP-dependent aminotransferase family protein [Lysobacter sp. TY2-98]|uniref:MocR-like pyridoxine biosynthesis transcription factor PdxR n=1 Tax=Lysobacter sp. TY2-98 TaxID=2290922 RepID=UPI000E203028|nr:PLP-dependent aminotransferase family protein [Lysobacter sp. TY2-98]AXK72916.1 PLP-dependent aminotransferase family protein [Lysobacter sp. TY2-98]
MDLILDGRGPRYLQLARALRAAIGAGRLPHGSRLPSTRELAASLGVSRTTVVAAYEHLHAEGHLEGKIGSGSYVQTPLQPSTSAGAVRRPVPAQSSFSARARRLHDPRALPGRRAPDVRYAFQYGFPSVNTEIATQWLRELARAAQYASPNYPPAQGLPALRDAVARHIGRTRGVTCDADDVVIVHGTQQALSLIANVLLDPGDDVAIEEPHYFGARRVLEILGARLHGVPVDREGLCVDRLPDPPAKVTYVTPSHQFPTGVVMSLERRHALLDYARRNDGWIIEDDYDGEFRHAQQPVSALQALDRDGRVLYVGTFSKTLFPSLRLGYIVTPPGLRDDLLAAKWVADFGTSPTEQAALASFIASGVYDRHLRVVTRRLAERRELLRRLLHERCGPRVEVADSKSGMHLLAWVRDLSRDGGDALVRMAQQRGVGLYTVASSYLDPPDATGLIMGFSAMSTREIREAMEIVADCLSHCPSEAR